MLKHIAALMLIGGFAASQNANAEPVEIDDLKANMADLSAKLPPAAKAKVSYKKDIKPLLEKSCHNCHGPKKRPKGKFRIDTRELALKGGSEGVAIIPGKSKKSPVSYFITDQVVDYEMPPTDKREKYPKLTKKQIALFLAWIDQGAKYDN
jgi:mono/diheme cytochrome c family protein